jgi:hypothetical protein
MQQTVVRHLGNSVGSILGKYRLLSADTLLVPLFRQETQKVSH